GELHHEARHAGVRQAREVLHHTLTLRQKLRATGRIVERPQVTVRSPIENGGNAETDPLLCLAYVVHRVQHGEHSGDVDLTDQHIADLGESVCLEALQPLSARGVTAPPVFVLLYVRKRTLPKGPGTPAFSLCRAYGAALPFQRVFTARQHAPVFDCPFTRFGERDVIARPHPDVARLAVTDVAENPRLRTPDRSLLITAVAAGDAPGLVNL